MRIRANCWLLAIMFFLKRNKTRHRLFDNMNITLVFSKDRAMQLDATLASFFIHAEDVSLTRVMVLYKASTALHQAQYELLEREYAGRVEFSPETDFRSQVLDLLISALSSAKLQRRYRFWERIGFLPPVLNPNSTGNSGHILFLVDDNIFINSFRFKNMIDALDMNSDALGFSLRLGTNTTYCYSMSTPQALPGFDPLSGGILKFDWTKSEGDFAYPLEVSSSIYSIEMILDLLTGLKFQNPNMLEVQMSQRRSRYKRKFPMMLCHEKSAAFCVPINRVQNLYQNRAGQNEGLFPERLAEMFAQGLRVDVLSLNGFVPNACHEEVELKFRPQ